MISVANITEDYQEYFYMKKVVATKVTRGNPVFTPYSVENRFLSTGKMYVHFTKFCSV